MTYRIAVDIGGTFSDVALEREDGSIAIHKAPSTPDDPVAGVLAALDAAAAADGTSRRAILAAAEVFIYTSTKAINAIVTGSGARTAFVTTAGHPDILLLREGGRTEPFDYTVPFPAPLVPRRLTFQVAERIDAAGRILAPLDPVGLERLAEAVVRERIEAVAVCLLWSIVNPAHELAVGRFLAERFPDLPVTLSHQLNPCLREYRRASSACLDAVLKPLMTAHLAAFETRLRQEGFTGTALAVTSQGGVVPIAAMARAPIHALNSGPAMAPVAGRAFAEADAGSATAVVIDTGGTTFDVSLVADGRLPATQELWIGGRYRGHITGFPSVDVSSVGAGGGSIAGVDEGGLLQVGPASAGAVPGPACYGRGGTAATVTDAALVLGYLDPAGFLGGRMPLDAALARAAIEPLAAALDIGIEDAAAAILEVAGEQMVQAIEEVTIRRGVDPARAVLVAGGGAAGLGAIELGRRLGCRAVLFPAMAPAMSAVGALLSDMLREVRVTRFARLDSLSGADLAQIGEDLSARLAAETAGDGAEPRLEYFLEGRYERQIWEIEIPLGAGMPGPGDLAAIRAAFDATHARLYGIGDPRSAVEVVSWGLRARTVQRAGRDLPRAEAEPPRPGSRRRRAVFAGIGAIAVPVLTPADIGHAVPGPLIVESAYTTIVVPPGAEIGVTAHGLMATIRQASGEIGPREAAA
ncbi:hydantoinase/oxoprolinase family protein [Prosthecodimorpha staleyi]|uniref:Hydantoinase/oxoprolinase family protein n=1 Tax=Prosthecodimorpha staleyi TaxID=2840188 RepID=A0A947D7K4_9HYPH|nr:hydantoinase/oxoprolinase family protein [Prosthecodimorpha staleyi]MBT9291564.1 hydantoinase/oxoprolinase family protein [Prosthecodimorpha staleyi]